MRVLGLSRKNCYEYNNAGYLEGQGHSANRIIAPITHIVTLLIPIFNLLTN